MAVVRRKSHKWQIYSISFLTLPPLHTFFYHSFYSVLFCSMHNLRRFSNRENISYCIHQRASEKTNIQGLEIEMLEKSSMVNFLDFLFCSLTLTFCHVCKSDSSNSSRKKILQLFLPLRKVVHLNSWKTFS